MTVAGAIAQVCAKPVTSAKARLLARDAIIDTLACMVAGREDASTKTVFEAFARTGSAGEALLVTGAKSSPIVAALVNGTAAHALDYDDNFLPGMSHASAVIVPALLAVADFEKTSGAQLIDAYLAGLQAQALIGAGVGQAHYTAGWHGTSTIGSIGTAAAVAHLLGLDEEATARAITIAVSYASGTKGQFGTLIKPFHAGMAARNAVEAALLAKAGMQARPDILEGAQGFHSLFAGDQRRGWKTEAIIADAEHIIETAGVMPKKHPCCGSTHLIVDGLLDLMHEHDFTAEDVDSIEALVGIANYRNLTYPQPVDEMQARFSMQYCVARALRQGHLSLADFTPQAVQHYASDALLNHVTMLSYSADEERIAQDKLPHVVTVKLHDGRVLTASRNYAVGGLQEPFTDADRLGKFMDCCGASDSAAGVYEELLALDDAKDLKALKLLFSSATS
ncbi:MmgE/PrpD family protein [Pseudochrobactrum sp. XF203]|uniref:MmgE/PrpD family protein n=1 Tax=Pseudochrobactrum sp. XF203 TaxID=2879116 RepID=UPI001CE38B76|nr:MmgE/PrpD family protein [Pseudochrobactrum sp. XF203]UCA45006.1 MmgE/PrpD family protein [Pseudochrobactrum sp. XF203]